VSFLEKLLISRTDIWYYMSAGKVIGILEDLISLL